MSEEGIAVAYFLYDELFVCANLKNEMHLYIGNK